MALKKSPEKDTSERYMLTYADLMNLLLVLFIILYSMSKTDVAKATMVAESIRKGFNASQTTSELGQSPNGQSTTSTAIAGGSTNSSLTKDYSEFYDQLVDLVRKAGIQSKVQITADNSDVVITLTDTALYAPGVATMNAQSQELMSSIGGLLKQVDYAMVMVEGYTDSDPIHTSQFQDNLDLSTARANNVNRLLVSVGIPSSKICSLGHGENSPVAPNDTTAHKAQNRRVVLTIFKNLQNLTANQIIAARDLLKLQSQNNAAAQSTVSAASNVSSNTSSKSGSSSSAVSKKTASSGGSSSKTVSKAKSTVP